MRNKDDLVGGMKLVMVKVWNLGPEANEGEIAHYASGLADRILANDTHHARRKRAVQIRRQDPHQRRLVGRLWAGDQRRKYDHHAVSGGAG